MKAAVLQMTGGIDPHGNSGILVDAIAEARQAGAVMLFTPEMSNVVDRYRTRAAGTIVAEQDDPVLTCVREAACAEGMWVHLGSAAIRRDDGRYANRGYVIDPAGTIVARYDKLHLFDVALASGESWRESAAYAAGDRAALVDTPLGTLGLSICYDLRFATLYAALSDAGATVLAVPAAFTRPTGAAHWEVLLRARAIENAAWVIAAAQVGEHEDGRATWGHSLVVDPWGEVVLDMGERGGLGLVDLDPACTADVRARVPVLTHRRPIPAVTR